MIISKSEYMMFLKHPAWLWVKKHAKDLIPPVSPELQARFDEGNQFEPYAEVLFPDLIRLGFNDFQSYLNFDVTNQISWFAMVKYNEIKTNTIQMPWHIPSTSLQMGSKFKLINDRLILAPFLINLSNIKALSVDENIIYLPNVIDFGMDINMTLNEKITTFLKIRNLLGKENQIFNLYSSREFDIYGGISVRF